MPNNETVKTTWTLKRILWLIPVGFFVVCCIYLAIMMVIGKGDSNSGADNNLQGKEYTLATGKYVYRLASVSSESAQQQGLSGTKSLASNKGMLFIDNDVARRCFWMKDMNYPLDIIWVGAGKKITHIERNLSPSTYPKAYCADAQYVIELNAGQADKSSMSVGQVLSF